MNLQKRTKQCQKIIQEYPNPGAEEYDYHTFKEVYTNFIECITQHNHRYYIQHDPLISDKEYDKLFDYLKKIEEHYPSLLSQDSPTQELVGQANTEFEKSDHPIKMLSLQNSYNAQDLIHFDETIQKSLQKENTKPQEYCYLLEPKFDGISVELVYQDNRLVQAITRGDGYTGDDITHNVLQIPNLPHKLNNNTDIGELRLRGEIMMPKSERKRLNQERIKQGKKVFANTRNAAAGTVKLLDTQEVKKRKLICFVYDILYQESQIIQSHQEMYQHLKNMGLPVFDRYRNHGDIQEIIELCEDPQTQKHFEQKNIDFDGIVIKINNYQQRELIGSTDHHPKRAIAYKFPAAQATTQIQKAEFQIGRTGIVTPVAHLTPTKLSGVTISRASLHNMDYIQQKDIRLHDRVWIQRSGEVIPYIVGVIKERREKTNQKIQTPQHCPSCGTTLRRDDVYVYCPNKESCSAQITQQITHFVSKQCMNIEGLGEKFVEILVQQNIIQSIADIYKLPSEEKQRHLRSLPGFGNKRVEELIKQIKNSQKNPLWRLINGLGLPGIGKKMAKELQNAIHVHPNKNGQLTHEKFLQLLQDEEFLSDIYGIGDTIIEDLKHRSQKEYNQDILQNLEKRGISFNNFGKSATGKMQGIHFSVTGSFEISRGNIIEQLEAQGAKFDNSPTQKTDFVLVGDQPGSKKTKAEKWNIPIINQISELEKRYKITINADKKKKKSPQHQSLF